MKKINITLSFLFLLSIFSIKLNAQTTITVGPSGDYTSLSNAIANISSYAEQELIINIQAGTYTEQVTIDSIGQTNFPFKLTIKPDTGNTNPVVFQAPSGINETNNFIFRIRNSNNVLIQNIQFNNPNSNYSRCIDVEGFNDNLKIDQCQFTGRNTSEPKDNNALIYFNKNSICSHFYFSNNHFIYGEYAIYSDYATIDGKISNNNFLDFSYNAIFLPKTNGLEINQNHITSDFDTIEKIGIFIDSCTKVKIQRNYIESGGGDSFIAIDAKNSDTLLVVNNMISIGGSHKSIGGQYKHTYVEYIFNNLFISGSNNSYGLILDSCDFHSKIINNIFDLGGNGSSGYFLDLNDFYYSQYNIFFNDNQQNNFAKFKGTDISSFNDWKQVSGKFDSQSFLGDPQYFSFQDLHVGNAALVVGRGDYIKDYTVDFDGNARKNPPDIGADEINGAIHGNISKDTTWSGFVYLDSSVVIEPGITLTILAGTKISVVDSVEIKNYGTITAQGNSNAQINFAYVDLGQKTGMTVAWKGIKNINNNKNIFEYCSFPNSVDGALYFKNNNNSTIDHCIFINNEGQNGSAIFSLNSQLTITNNDFYQNHSYNNGGALYLSYSSLVANNIFYQNHANKGGGDIYLSSDTSKIEDNTFYQSWANTGGSSIETVSSKAVIANSIFWGFNTGDTVINVNQNPVPTISNIDIQGGHASIRSLNGLDTNKIYDFTPGFIDANANNFRLLAHSKAIDKGTLTYAYATDKDNNIRPYNSGLPDLGAYEFQGVQMKVFAGKDTTICSKSINLYAQDPAPYKGTWSSPYPNINFQDVNNPKTKISNLSPGNNEIIWTVSDGAFNLSDTMIITELMPPSFYFSDMYLVSKDYPNLITDTIITAYDPVDYTSGQWSSPDGNIIIASPNYMTTQISGLKRGKNTLLWTVDNNGCKNVDTLTVFSGFSITPQQTDSVNWDNPSTWNISAIPGLGDSVNISGAKIFIDASNALCGKLVVSSASHLFLNGSAKGPAILNTDRIYVEQNPEKKYKGDDTARLTINNGQLYLKDASGSLSDGLIVGSKGRVVLDPQAGGVAEIHLGKNRQLKVKAQAIYKNAQGTGQIVIKNGGKIYVEQNAEKKSQKNYDKNVYVGSGGRIYIEQNPEKKTSATSELIVGRGNRIYVEQNAEKAYEGGQIIINGGKIYVEQNAEKASQKGSFYELNVHRGGKIYVEQNAEKKSLDSSVLQVPRILIDNGQLIVGSSSNKKANTAIIHANKIYVEQNAEKQVSNDSALIIKSGGTIDIKSTNYMKGELYLGAKNALSISPGGILSFADSSRLIYQQEASIIDHGNNNIPATELITFNSNNPVLYSLPFESYAVKNTNPNINLFFWNESNNKLYSPDQQAVMKKGFAYDFVPPAFTIQMKAKGILNTGDISVPLSMSNQGINLIGNPYPSALLVNNISFPAEVQNSIYFYSSVINNYIVYQQNGMNIFNIDPLIFQNQGFFVVTNAATNFTFPAKAQIHNYFAVKSKTTTNELSFIVSSHADLSDALGLSFKNSASGNYDNKEDALKLQPLRKYNYISLYTYSDDNKKLQINTLKPPADNSTIPIYFISDQTGNFSINLNNRSISSNVKIYLIDPLISDTTDLQTQQNYSFNYNTQNIERKFLLLFKGQITKNNENLSQTKIYSFNKNIYLQTAGQNIDKVEIYNLSGIKIITKTINSDKTIIKTNLEKGIYIVRAFLSNQIVTQKIIIN